MKTLIVYFSYSNNTKNLIESINKDFNFDVVRVEREVPYSDDYDTCAYKEAKEEVERDIHPKIKPITKNIDDHDKILLFFPIWWYTFPMPIATFIEEHKNYKGEVYVFANSYTNDPHYMANSMRDLKKIAPLVNFKRALFNESARKHIEFIKNISEV